MRSDISVSGSIFSTHVEMNRKKNLRIRGSTDFLYARGDEPLEAERLLKAEAFSLRTWR